MEDHAMMIGADAKTDAGIIIRKLATLEETSERLHKTVSVLEAKLRPVLSEIEETSGSAIAATLSPVEGSSHAASELERRIASLESLADHIAWLTQRVEV